MGLNCGQGHNESQWTATYLPVTSAYVKLLAARVAFKAAIAVFVGASTVALSSLVTVSLRPAALITDTSCDKLGLFAKAANRLVLQDCKIWWFQIKVSSTTITDYEQTFAFNSWLRYGTNIEEKWYLRYKLSFWVGQDCLKLLSKKKSLNHGMATCMQQRPIHHSVGKIATDTLRAVSGSKYAQNISRNLDEIWRLHAKGGWWTWWVSSFHLWRNNDTYDMLSYHWVGPRMLQTTATVRAYNLHNNNMLP